MSERCPKCLHEWSVLACEECGERWERPDDAGVAVVFAAAQPMTGDLTQFSLQELWGMLVAARVPPETRAAGQAEMWRRLVVGEQAEQQLGRERTKVAALSLTEDVRLRDAEQRVRDLEDEIDELSNPLDYKVGYDEGKRSANVRVAALEAALRDCASTAGHPDAAEGCRLIIGIVRDALATVYQEADHAG